MEKRIRLIHHEIEQHVVIASGNPCVLDVYEEGAVNITFYWRGKDLPYTISLPMLSELLKKQLYPDKEKND